MPRPNAPQQRQSAPIIDPRDAAYRHLSKQARRLPDLLPSEVQVGSLDARDSALAHAIVDGAITRWITLDYIVSCLSGRNLREQEPRMQAVLLGGAAQLLLLDRVPAHAVLDESVEWAKRNIRPKAGGMVNAILRKVAAVKGERLGPWAHHVDSIPLDSGDSLGLVGLELPGEGPRRLTVACSLPGAIIRRWEERFGDPTPQAMHTLCKAPTLVCVAHARDAFESELLAPHESPEHRVFTGTRQELIALLAGRDDLWVQDPASTRTLGGLDLPAPPALVVDLCAGQGTKTRQLCAKYPDAKIIACEVDKQRLDTLREVFAGHERVVVAHAERVGGLCEQGADLVLADVPCSNTGVLARRREARYRPLEAQLSRLTATQRDIVSAARSLLRDGGHLLYATCSLEGEENEAIAEQARDDLGLELLAMHRVEPMGQPGDEPRAYRDGSFSALLRL